MSVHIPASRTGKPEAAPGEVNFIRNRITVGAGLSTSGIQGRMKSMHKMVEARLKNAGRASGRLPTKTVPQNSKVGSEVRN